MKQGKICIYPGCNELAGHVKYKSLCVHHGEERQRKHRQKYEETHPDHVFRPHVCRICQRTFRSKTRQLMCPECRKNYVDAFSSTGKYGAVRISGSKIDEHRRVAKTIGVITSRRDVVHHLDGNKSNNDPSNLLVIDIAHHNALHVYLRTELAKNPNLDIAQLTREFLYQNYIPHWFCNETPPNESGVNL